MTRLSKQYKFIIFDFDGTINNTSPGIYATFTKVLSHFGVDASSVDLSCHIGPPLTDSYTKLVGAENCAKAIELHKKVFDEDQAAENSFLYDGIVDVLENLYRSGKYKLFIASSKYEPHAVFSLKYHNIDKYFSGVYGQTATRGFKEEVLAQLIEEQGLDKSQCLMIGDTMHDVTGANANGIDVVAVTYGFEKRARLQHANVIALCDTPSDILELLL